MSPDFRSAPAHSWSPVDARLFMVRTGPDYARHKRKAPSARPLYEPVAVDIFW